MNQHFWSEQLKRIGFSLHTKYEFSLSLGKLGTLFGVLNSFFKKTLVTSKAEKNPVLGFMIIRVQSLSDSEDDKENPMIIRSANQCQNGYVQGSAAVCSIWHQNLEKFLKQMCQNASGLLLLCFTEKISKVSCSTKAPASRSTNSNFRLMDGSTETLNTGPSSLLTHTIESQKNA